MTLFWMVLRRHRAIFRPSSENIVEENDGLVPPTANQYPAIMQRSLILLLTFFLSSLANAQFGGGDKSTFKSVSQVTGIAPGETFKIALQLNHPDHWHSYYVNPGILGTSMKVDWALPDGFTASETIFAIPRAIETKSGGLDTVLYGYEGEVAFYYEITAPKELALGKDLTISGKAGWQICDEGSCVQESGEIFLVIKSA
ncbi:protein-disulfide reductase DsbD family protein, partial [bacterium]|nr:protein-disulfide reductase DsbD family protein [bacterium]